MIGDSLGRGGDPVLRRPAVSAVTVVELEALYLRMELGQTTHDDANLVRSIMQGLIGRIRNLEQSLPDEDGV